MKKGVGTGVDPDLEPDPEPDPLVRGTDPGDPDPDPHQNVTDPQHWLEPGPEESAGQAV